MTPHATYQEQLLDLAYGELGKREARALRAHLEGCPGCRAELARMTATRSAMAALPEEPAPGRGEAILLAAAREVARERRPRPLLPSWVWSVSVGAVGLAAVALLTVRLGGTVTNRVAQPQGGELVSKIAQADDAKPTAPAAEVAPAPGGASEAAEAPPAGKPARPAPGREGPAAKAAPARADKGAEVAGLAQAAGDSNGKRRQQPAPPPGPSTKRKAPARAARDELAFGKDERAEKRSPGAGPDGTSTSGAAGPVASADAAGPGEPAAQPRVAGSAAPSAPPPPSPAPRAEFARPPPAAARLEEEQDRVASAEKKEQSVQRNRAAGAKVRAAPVAAEDAMARYEDLRAAGRLHTATVSFSDCPGETSRRVEQDDEDRVVKVTRRGALHGTSFEAEQFYRQDGALGAVRYRAAGAVQELRLGAAGAGAASTAGGIPASVLEPQHAAEAGLDAPPRCEE